MAQLDAAIRKYLSHEQTSVAVLRISLAADQRDPVLGSPVEEALDRGLERLLLGHRPIQRVPLGVVVLLAVRAPAERFAQEQVVEPAATELGVELLAVEVGRKPRVRKRPHVDEKLDALAGDQLDEPIEPVIGMTDRPHSQQ